MVQLFKVRVCVNIYLSLLLYIYREWEIFTHTRVHTHTHTHTYVYIVFFGSVKVELGVIPSGQKETFHSEDLNFPDKKLNVTDITEQLFL